MIPLSILFTGRDEKGLTGILNLGGRQFDIIGWRKGTDPDFSVVACEIKPPDDKPDAWFDSFLDGLSRRVGA